MSHFYCQDLAPKLKDWKKDLFPCRKQKSDGKYTISRLIVVMGLCEGESIHLRPFLK